MWKGATGVKGVHLGWVQPWGGVLPLGWKGATVYTRWKGCNRGGRGATACGRVHATVCNYEGEPAGRGGSETILEGCSELAQPASCVSLTAGSNDS